MALPALTQGHTIPNHSMFSLQNMLTDRTVNLSGVIALHMDLANKNQTKQEQHDGKEKKTTVVSSVANVTYL